MGLPHPHSRLSTWTRMCLCAFFMNCLQLTSEDADFFLYHLNGSNTHTHLKNNQCFRKPHIHRKKDNNKFYLPA